MNTRIAFFAVALATLAHAQEPIPVYLDPSSDALQIGELESRSLAVPAEWPMGSEQPPGWRPVYYQGRFEVYVDNNDIGKDLAPKPGSVYYTAPDRNAAKLAIATEKDETDIISVDTWFAKLRLETILLGYIPDAARVPDPEAVATAPQPSDDETSASEAPVSELEGRLEKAGLLARNRHGVQYRLANESGKTIAFVDVSELPERIQADELLSDTVRISGALQANETSGAVIVVAQSLKKAN